MKDNQAWYIRVATEDVDSFEDHIDNFGSVHRKIMSKDIATSLYIANLDSQEVLKLKICFPKTGFMQCGVYQSFTKI